MNRGQVSQGKDPNQSSMYQKSLSELIAPSDRESVITHVNSVDISLTNLNNRLQDMYERLQPILFPDTPTDGVKAARGTLKITTSEMSDNLIRITDRIDEMTEHAERIITRIDL